MRSNSTIHNILASIALVSLFSACHANHHESSKSKYQSLAKKVAVKVPLKENADLAGYFSLDLKNQGAVHVKKVWPDSPGSPGSPGTKEQSCRGCHRGYTLDQMAGKKHRRSHWNIKLQHAAKEVMNCQTCHTKDAVWSFNFGSKSVSANHSLKLCSQCHFKQRKDWEIGAHGKRANGWQYKRAIYNCVSCHNPHSPSFKKRWPKVAPYRPINNEERL